ncbi:Nucleoid-associated protein YejK [compost metagenome]
MSELKLKGHDIDISNIVVHKINKVGGIKNTALKLAEKELIIGSQEINFVADTKKSFQDRSKPTYGIFDESNTFNDFHNQLKSYVTDKINFLDFTCSSMKYYENQIKKSAPATGAFVVFANYIYKPNRDRYLLIFSINNKEGYNLNEESLTIQQILNLDLSKMDVAALINISKWQKSLSDKTSDIRTYLSFIKGKKKLSDYFLDFIGCADKSTNTDSSKLLLSALNQYMIQKNYSKEEVKSRKKSVFDYCQTCVKEKREVLLDQISYLLNDDDPEEFSRFASSEEYGVSEIIKADTNILRSLQYIDYKGSDLTISFNTNKLTTRDVIYNSEAKTLTFKNLPDSLIKQLEYNG